MTTVHHTGSRPHTRGARPLVAALTGAAVFIVAMAAGQVFDLNADASDAPATTFGELVVYAVLVLAVVALATWLGHRGLAGAPDRLARHALGLALGSAITFVAFWSGWPQVLGATAVALAVEHRRRIGGWSGVAGTAAVLGAVALVASAYVCVIG